MAHLLRLNNQDNKIIMREIILSIILAVGCCVAHAQQTYEAYCDITEFGRHPINMRAILSFNFGGDRNVDLLGDDGKPIKFGSYISAAMYLSHLGWSIVSTFQGECSYAKNMSAIHCIMRKLVSNDGEIMEGLKVKDTTQKNDKKNVMEEYGN